MALLLAILLLGTVAALVRAGRALRRADHLEKRVRALEARLTTLEPRDILQPAAPRDLPVETSATPIPEVTPPHRKTAPVPISSTTSAEERRIDLEAVIGGRWLLFAGIAAIVLGMSYFVKFAFDNGWISEPLRVAAGGVVGTLLVAAGVRFSSRGLALFGQALAGAGIIVLYVAIYAALHFYALIGDATAFVLMVIVTSGAAYLADRQRSQSLAALALVGGFATPMLVGGDRQVQVVLFTYMGILIAGAALLERRHDWPLLGAASYVCTFVLVVAWFFSSYEAHLWLTTELFLTAYVVMFGYMLATALRARTAHPASGTPHGAPGTPAFARALAGKPHVAVLATAPLTYHVASVLVLVPHPAAWLVYVVLATLAGILVSHRMRSGAVRIVVLLAVGLPMAAWLGPLPYARWHVPAVLTVFAIYALHLLAQWEAGGEGNGGGRKAVDVLHGQLNGLLLPLSLYVFLEHRYAWLNPWMAAGLSAWNAALAVFASTWTAGPTFSTASTRAVGPTFRSGARQLTIQFVALSATLAAIAVVLAFEGPAVAFGWAAEGVVVVWLALRERSRTLALGGAALITMGSLQLFNLLSLPLPAGDTPVLNARALAAALVIAMLAWLAWRMRDHEGGKQRGQARTAVIVLANLLALAWISADLSAYFAQRALDASIGGEPRAAADANLAEQVALSVTWALYAVGLIFAGIRRRFAPARYLAIALFAIVVTKVLIHDIAGLDRLYRMLSVLGVGVLLVVASYLYQKMPKAENEG